MKLAESVEGAVQVGVAVLTLTFTMLRVSGVIDWSWVWVLSPAWVYLLAIGAVVLFVSLWIKFLKIMIGLDGRK